MDSSSKPGPFTLEGWQAEKARAQLAFQTQSPDAALPPKKVVGTCNYWQLDEQIISNMTITVQPVDPSVPVFKEPHAFVEGVVEKIIKEGDGDHHVWVGLDNSKARLACEWIPQSTVQPPPPVGTRIRIGGVWRYDLQHGWWEIHPVDWWEAIDGAGAT